MACDYCNAVNDSPSTKAIFELDVSLGVLGCEEINATIWRYKDTHILDIGFGHEDHEIKINYCPMCGRKLGEE